MADIKSGRLDEARLQQRFAEVYEPLDRHEAHVESDRCYFCYDAPCVTACPTSIDIPLFIREISVGNANGAAKTILDANIMGGMCARVCPTETLCEEVCVREVAEGKPVKIGELQRFATDNLMATTDAHPFTRAAETGKRVAVIGAGPAGLSCAHRLAMHGHDVTIFEALPKPGGLNEFGIAAYKAMDDFAQAEVDFILGIGGIDIEYGKALGNGVSLDTLTADYDATFIGMGLPGTNELGLDGEDADGCIDAVDYIAQLRQSDDLSKLPVGRNVVVIGGGMTAIDIAAQTKLLGAENVTIFYRRGMENMNASQYEQDHAQKHGVTIRQWLQPKALHVTDGAVSGMTFEYTSGTNGSLRGTGETVSVEADQVFKAIGQTPASDLLAAAGITLERGRIAVDANRKTSHVKIWAGGDCVAGGEDLTVVSVEDGKLAAEDIHKMLSA
ncbi:NAD(P)-dependent oxidoreductase [Ahrensia sp. R2A130]|uniref:NAD(P)-dependent oxidoreductase n=1 Tax=Ahrensia sp. R2A130 TaxID=744979 RepID=UPI0001E0C3A4|nr:NAD(P)-dependent oxidoreductase [Ahrensia sp. R2A130]EFL87599.1 pyridine nucleotide-disulfide oxidoreductase family protein [Ahrensia sp. R2A130]